MKKVLSVILALTISGTVCASDIWRFSLPDWRWTIGDNSEYAEPGFDDSGWETIRLPRRVKPGKPRATFWLRGVFTLPEAAVPPIWFLSGKGGCAFELYVNGVYAGQRGSLTPDFSYRNFYISAVMLPADLKPGETVTIALRCNAIGTGPVIPLYSFGNKAAMNYDTQVINFFNGRLFGIFGSICLFLSFYCFCQIIASKKKDMSAIYLALLLLCNGISLLENGAGVWPFQSDIFYVIARCGLIIGMLFLPPFLMEFFNRREASFRRVILTVCMAIDAVCLAALLIVSGDITTFLLIFNICCVFVLGAIIFGIVLCVKSIKSGDNAEVIPILVSLVAGLALAVHDLIASLVNLPGLFYQGMGVFFLSVATFIVLALRESKLREEAERITVELDANTRALSHSFSQMKETGLALSELGQNLEQVAAQAFSAAALSDEQGRVIHEEAGNQAQSMEEAGTLVNNFVSSITRISQNIGEQSNAVDAMDAAGKRLSQGAQAIVSNAADTASFTERLAALTQKSMKAADSLNETMQSVSESSRSISDVVAVVEEFVEQTSLLSMNAAIEAAHAGASGSGFAIVAQEIKRLAESQRKQVSDIRGIIGAIVVQIRSGAENAGALQKSLAEITQGAEEAAQKIGTVLEESQGQKGITHDLGSAVTGVSAAFASIGEELGRQTDYSNQVRHAVYTISEQSAAMAENTEQIIGAIVNVKEIISSLSDMATRSRRMTAELLGINDE